MLSRLTSWEDYCWIATSSSFELPVKRYQIITHSQIYVDEIINPQVNTVKGYLPSAIW